MGTLAKGEPRPLEPIDTLLDTGRVLALNFPVAMNPVRLIRSRGHVPKGRIRVSNARAQRPATARSVR